MSFVSISFWHWLILGFALIAFEMLAPGTFLLWPGIAAVLTGMVAYSTDWAWQVDAALFAVLTVLCAVAGRRLYGRWQGVGNPAVLNRRAQAFLGSEHVLDAPMTAGRGRLKLGDTTWRISGPDLAAGDRVRIVGVDGITLQVEKIEP